MTRYDVSLEIVTNCGNRTARKIGIPRLCCLKNCCVAFKENRQWRLAANCQISHLSGSSGTNRSAAIVNFTVCSLIQSGANP